MTDVVVIGGGIAGVSAAEANTVKNTGYIPPMAVDVYVTPYQELTIPQEVKDEVATLTNGGMMFANDRRTNAYRYLKAWADEQDRMFCLKTT